MFYKTDYENPVKESLIDLFKTVKNYSVVYAHNFDRFDSVYIIKELINLNCKLDFIVRDQSVLGIKAKYNKKTLLFRDSYKILPQSLDNLAKAFNLSLEKDFIPYEFIEENNLNYIGEVPDLKYFKNISLEKLKYLEENKNNYNLKDEVLKYLENDLKILYYIMKEYFEILNREYQLNIRNNCSISGIALKLWRTKYYKIENGLGMIELNTNKLLRNSYHGGVVNVFKPILKGEGYYYDVNSLYPYVMCKDLPVGMPEHSKYSEDLENIFGIVRATVDVPYSKYPFLVFKDHNLGLTQPLGKWTGWFTSEELKYAKTLGVKIEVLESYKFEKENLFNEYVKDFYDKKSNSSGSLKLIYKLFLNSLYGIFGLNPDNTKFVTLDNKQQNEILKLKESFPINLEIDCGFKTLLSYDYKPTEMAQTQYGYLPVENESLITNTPIAAMITSYARIHMHKLIMEVDKLGGNIYYTDTDSIVTDIKLPGEFVSDNEIGKLKNEFPDDEITEGIFVLPKTYGIKLKSGKTFVKAKGVSQISYKEIRGLYEGQKISSLEQRSKKLNIINPIEFKKTMINLSLNSFKRDQIFDSNKKWVDTKPYNINEL